MHHYFHHFCISIVVVVLVVVVVVVVIAVVIVIVVVAVTDVVDAMFEHRSFRRDLGEALTCSQGIGVNVQSAAALFHLLDSDHNGMIDRGEFLRHIFPDECGQGQRWQVLVGDVVSGFEW